MLANQRVSGKLIFIFKKIVTNKKKLINLQDKNQFWYIILSLFNKKLFYHLDLNQENMQNTSNQNKRPIKFEALIYADSQEDLLKSLERIKESIKKEIEDSREISTGIVRTASGGGVGDDTITKISRTH